MQMGLWTLRRVWVRKELWGRMKEEDGKWRRIWTFHLNWSVHTHCFTLISH